MDEASATMGWMGDSFTVVPNYVITDDKVDQWGMLAYIALRHFMSMDKGMVCYPSMKTLAKIARCSKDSVRRGIKVLRDAGYVEVRSRLSKDGDQTSNLYVLRSHPVADTEGVIADSNYPHCCKRHEQEPVEQEPENKTLPSPSAPVLRKAKHAPEDIAFAKELASLLQEKDGPWAAYSTEIATLYKLISYAKRAGGELWQDFLSTFIAKAFEMRQRGDKELRDKALTPRFLIFKANYIAQSMKTKVVVDPFAEYQK